MTIADDEAKVARAAFGDDAQATAAWTGSVVEGQTLTVPITVSHLPGSPLAVVAFPDRPFTIDVDVVTGDLIYGIREFLVVGEATFRPTDRSRTKTIVTVTARDDDVAEPTEYVTLYIGRGTPYRQGPAATITVIDNDTPPGAADLTGLTVTDGDGAAVTLAPAFASAIGTYTAQVANTVTAVRVTPTVGGDAAAKTITVAGAAVDSGAASSPITLVAGTPKAIAIEVQAGDGVTRTYTVTVTRRGAPGRLTLSARGRVGEGEGSFTVTATLDRPAPAGGVGVTLSAAAESTATNADYTLPGALRIAAGRRSAGATVTITGDRIDEEDETIVLSATTTAAGVTVAGATVTIVDDDAAGVRIDPTTVVVDERQHQRARHGATARYAVALTSEPTHPVTVTPASGDPAAARVAPATLTFNARTWQTAQTVAVTGVQDADRIDETVTITHRVASSDARYASLTPAAVTASVVDDDGGGTFRVAFGRDGQDTAWTATVAEGDGTLVIPVTTGFQAFERVSFEVEAVAAETTAGAGDYRLGATSVTFGPTDISRTRSLTIAIADDALVESTETVTLRFTGRGEGQLLFFSRHGPAATVTITDDDAAAARIAFGDDAQAGAAWSGSVTEGAGTLAVPVTVSHLPSAPTTFPVTLAAGTSTGFSDFELGSVTFGPATARTRTLTVTATDDALVESAETLALRIAPPADPARGLGDHYARGGGATVTLVDDDAAAARIAFGNDAQATAAYAVTVAEAVGTLTVPVTVSHLPDEATTFSVTIDQDATTAQFLGDYLHTRSVTFGAGERHHPAPVHSHRRRRRLRGRRDHRPAHRRAGRPVRPGRPLRARRRRRHRRGHHHRRRRAGGRPDRVRARRAGHRRLRRVGGRAGRRGPAAGAGHRQPPAAGRRHLRGGGGRRKEHGAAPARLRARRGGDLRAGGPLPDQARGGRHPR